MKTITNLILGCLLLAIGCSGSTTETASTSAEVDPTVSTSSTPPAMPDMSQALGGGQPAAPSIPLAPEPPQEAPQEVEEERQVAVAGVGKKGSRYGGGIISEPVSQYFGARERITFINIQKAMRTFKAMHDRDPESHEEFMEKIIQENGMELPSLFAGERYEYDPETAELMVVRPKKR